MKSFVYLNKPAEYFNIYKFPFNRFTKVDLIYSEITQLCSHHVLKAL